jgi:amino acid adenylation domain-containing protein/non-ribosomal peptide synthase protein (TIGR01720 family)
MNQSDLKDHLSAEKLELLAYLLEEEGIEISPTETITPRKTQDNLPLSYAQQRLWFLQQLEPDNPFYNIPSALRLRGSLNIPILESCFNQIIQRHEILRTKFSSIDGQPIQIITPELNLTLPIIDLSNLSAKEREAEARRIIDLEAQTPFNLEIPPLLRSSLLRLDKAEYILLFTMHHIISDGWSTDVMVREIVTLYESLTNNQPSTLPELTIQYADYAIWQRQWLQEEILTKQLAFWQQKLAEASVLPFPIDKPRPHIQTYQGTKQAFVISPELTNALKILSQQENCTLFMILLAAFKVLLSRYTATEDMVVGSPIANRNRTQIEDLIGFFVNTLVLRTNLAENPTFLELLARVRDCTLSAYANQDVPFDLIVEAIKPDRHLSHTPLFQVMFVLQNAPQSNMELPDLTWESLEIVAHTTKFDLTLLIEETETELKANWEYNTDLFNSDTIARMSAHFQTLLAGIITNPQQSIAQLPLLTTKEQQQLLVEWNGTQAEYSLDKSIHQLFEEQVAKTPDAVAVVFGNSNLTYKELNTKANQLAHYLQKNGVKTDILVGICLERSLEMAIAFLAVLKAGGAYVPLDPSYPPERLHLMVEDANLSVLLTPEILLDLIPNSQAKINIICLDTEWETIAQNSSINPVKSVTPNNLAYIIYTSGSTGTPKGVMIPHRALSNHMLWMQTELPLNSSDKVLQKTPFSFDASVWEFYAPLLVGGQLILAKPDGHQAPGYLTELIIKENITILQLVPSLLRVLLEEENIPNCQSLRRVFCGGEILPWELQQRFYNQLKHCQLYNLYGPTEATIDTTYWLCPRQEQAINSIGKPISNVQVYILDAYLQPVPIGVPGEIYIGGAGLARGYLNRPELTKEKFITVGANHLSPLQNNKLYKTGDLGRYLPALKDTASRREAICEAVSFRSPLGHNGKIEFLGRIDNQVKLRGFRIELGEIESKLEQHPQIKQAVVQVREDLANQQRLVAYLVSRQEQSPTTSELRSYLSEKLPEYMIPAVFLFLDSFPLTPNGKIDRNALPIPEITIERELTVNPRNQIESSLVNIWTEVLQVDNIGINDNFFELGGDSILSLQVIAKARGASIQLSPKQIFQYQTIADLATVANTTTAQKAEQGLVTGVFPLTPIQQRFFAQKFIDSHHWNQSVILEVNNCSPTLLAKAVQHLWEHHDILRSHFVETESAWECAISVGATRELPLDSYQLSELSEDRQRQEIEEIASELQSGFNLSEGQLIKIVWFDLGKQQSSRLLIIAHHLIIDGVSWRILLEDLEIAYQQLSQGKAVKLPAKTTSYKYWAEQLQKYAQSETVKEELNYWLNLLEGTGNRDKFQVLPVDFPGGDNTVASAGTVSITLTEEETQTLLSKVPSAYQTQINDVLLTALVQAFQEWTGSNSLLIELEGHGREDILANVDLSRTVGWFTTIFPVLLNLGTNSNRGETLKTIKEQLRSIPHRGINYGILRYSNNDPSIKKKLQNLLQAEVRFNYLGQLDQITHKSSLFQPANESTGNHQSLKGHRDCSLEINSAITKGQLFFDWTYSQALYRETTIQQLAANAIAILRSLITHCQASDFGGYTPSDFPQMQLNQTELDLLLCELNS